MRSASGMAPRYRRSGVLIVGTMKRVSVESTVIAAVGYDPSTAVLEIAFTSGDVYRYYAVPPSVHRGIMSADSAGRYFARHIRPVYPSERVR